MWDPGRPARSNRGDSHSLLHCHQVSKPTLNPSQVQL